MSVHAQPSQGRLLAPSADLGCTQVHKVSAWIIWREYQFLVFYLTPIFTGYMSLIACVDVKIYTWFTSAGMTGATACLGFECEPGSVGYTGRSRIIMPAMQSMFLVISSKVVLKKQGFAQASRSLPERIASCVLLDRSPICLVIKCSQTNIEANCKTFEKKLKPSEPLQSRILMVFNVCQACQPVLFVRQEHTTNITVTYACVRWRGPRNVILCNSYHDSIPPTQILVGQCFSCFTGRDSTGRRSMLCIH